MVMGLLLQRRAQAFMKIGQGHHFAVTSENITKFDTHTHILQKCTLLILVLIGKLKKKLS